MSQVLFNPRKMDPSQKFPGWTRKPLFLGPQDVNPHPGAMEPRTFLFSSWTIVFTHGLCNMPGEDSGGLLIQEPPRTNSNAALRPHRKMLVSITPSVQTAINRFCPGSVDFSFRTISVLFPWISQGANGFLKCLFFSTFSGWTSPCPWTGRPNLVPQAYWGYWNHSRQLRHTNSSKLLRLGLVVGPLTMQSNFDCCAAAHGYLPGQRPRIPFTTGELRQPHLAMLPDRTTIVSCSEFRHGGPCHPGRTLCCCLSCGPRPCLCYQTHLDFLGHDDLRPQVVTLRSQVPGASFPWMSSFRLCSRLALLLRTLDLMFKNLPGPTGRPKSFRSLVY